MNCPEEIIQVQNNADCLYSTDQLDHAIQTMAIAINKQLSDENPLCLCVLNGAIVITGKLLPQLEFPLHLDCVNATRYGNKTYGDEIEWLYRPATSVANRTILIIDDILDQGVTLAAVKEDCLRRGAKKVYSAVLVDKITDHEKPIKADFIGVTADNRYLFGYGMDYQSYLRNAPGLYACNLLE